jgi:hypothetical protein
MDYCEISPKMLDRERKEKCDKDKKAADRVAIES